MWNLKTVSALAASALLGASGVYVTQQRETSRLRAQIEELRHHQAEPANGEDTRGSHPLPDAVTLGELERLRKDNADLLRLRNEVTRLRQERNAMQEGAQATIPTPATAQANPVPGRYITREQLSFAGYGSPEAALESITWAMINGKYEQSIAGLGPDLLAGELKNPKAREQFEKGSVRIGPMFKGMQVLAQKTLAEDKVELKIRQDWLSGQTPGAMVQPMIKVGNEWKLGESTRSWTAKWDEQGDIHVLSR